MEFSTIYNVCVASSVICSVIEFKMVLTAYCKQRIIQLYFERGISYGNVANVLTAEGFRLPKQTMWVTIQKYKRHGTISRLPGSGRPFKLTRKMLDAIEEQMKQDDETMATQLVKMLGERGFKISTHTVKRARKSLGWTFHGSQYCQLIRNANKEKRVQWVKDNLHSSFDDVVSTDESTIQLENNRTFSYRKVGSAPKPKPRAKHPFKVMVWAGISKKGAMNICLLGCSVNSAVYQEVLRTHLLPFLREWLPNGRFQQDNAPCHTSKATQRFFQANRIKVLKTSPESLDFIKSNQKSVARDETFHSNNCQTQEQRRTLARHTVILGHRDTGKVLQVYRTFEKGYAQSYRSEWRSYRLLTFIFGLCLCYLFLPCSCAYSRSRNDGKITYVCKKFVVVRDFQVMFVINTAVC